jgi:NitT/TauT family transport system substrate-binding protein
MLLPMLVVALLLSSCDREEPETLRIGTALWPGYEPLFLAKERDYYGDQSISLVEYPSPAGAVRALANGAIAGAALTLDEVLKLAEMEVPLKVVLVLDVSNGGDALLARPKFDSVEKLKGARIGVEPSVLGRYMLTRALELHDLSIEDVELVYIESTEHEAAYKADKIDALITYEPALTHVLSRGAKSLFSSRDIRGEIVDVLAIRQSYLDKNPKAVRNLINGWYKALNDLEHDEKAASIILSQRLHISPDEVLNSFNGLRLVKRDEARTMLHGVASPMTVVADRLFQLMQEQGVLKNKEAHIGLFSADYID